SIRFDVNGVQRFTCCHKQPIPFCAAETDIGAGLRQANHSETISIRRHDLNARAGAGPDVAVDIAANAIGGGRLACAWNVELSQTLAVPDGLAVDIPDFDLARRSGVGNVDLLVIR